MHESEKWKWSRSVVSDSLRPHGLQPTRLLHPWDFPGKGAGVGCHCLLWITFYTSGQFQFWGLVLAWRRRSAAVEFLSCPTFASSGRWGFCHPVVGWRVDFSTDGGSCLSAWVGETSDISVLGLSHRDFSFISSLIHPLGSIRRRWFPYHCVLLFNQACNFCSQFHSKFQFFILLPRRRTLLWFSGLKVW